MSNPLLRLITSVNRRVAVTILGVAVCIMFLTGTLALLGGLHLGSESLAARFERGPLIVYDGLSLSESRLSPEALESLSDPAAVGYVTHASLESQAGFLWNDTLIVWVDDPEDLFGLASLSTLGSQAVIGADILAEASAQNMSFIPGEPINLMKGGEVTGVSFNSSYATSTIFPNDWVFVSSDVFEAVDSGRLGEPSWIMLPPESDDSARRLMDDGYTVVPTAGVVTFFADSVAQAEEALWTIVVLSGGIITLLVYNFLSTEVEYRMGDIRILRKIGARRSLIMQVFLGKCLFVSVCGGVLGLSLGMIASNAVVSASQLLSSGSFIFPQATASSLGIPFLVSIVAGLVGGAIPALRAAKTDVRMEAENAA